MTGLLNRTQAAKEIGIRPSRLAQFEADNPEVVRAAGVRRHYAGGLTIHYRPGALRAWLDGSPAVDVEGEVA